MFLTETAQLADVIFPAANLYEKSGTVTNTFGDLQLVKKAADRAGVRTDFELIVRLAAAMGADVKKLVPFGPAAFAPTSARPAARNPAKPIVTASGSPRIIWSRKLSPFDPFAILDEIQRLVPAYDVPRLDLLAGNDQHLKRRCSSRLPTPHRAATSLLPSNDTLFTSGTLGRYSNTLHSVLESRKPVETAAD